MVDVWEVWDDEDQVLIKCRVLNCKGFKLTASVDSNGVCVHSDGAEMRLHV